MSFGSAPSMNSEDSRVLSLRVSQSAYGGAKPRIWGKCRVPGNLLDYFDFTAIPHTSTSSAGGKGMGGGGESTNTSYTYTAGMVLGLGVGVAGGIGAVWKDKEVTDLSTLGLTLKTGALGQAVWAHLEATEPDRAVSYSGITYVCSPALDLDSSGGAPNLSFEVFGERLIAGGDDALPADIIADICNDTVEGVGLPAGIVGDTTAYALWCHEKGFTLSLAATAQRPARDCLADILKATLAEPIWSAGQIKIIPYGDEPVGAWTPDTTARFALTAADLLSPPDPDRTQPADAVNRITLSYTSRAADYNTATLTRDDLALVTQFGARPETVDLPCITSDTLAAQVCEFWRDRGSYIRNTWTVEVDERFCLVEPMDLGTLSYEPHAMNAVAVRVKEVTDHGDGKLTWLVEEWPYGMLRASAIVTQTVSGYVPQYNIAPGATHTPVIFEAPNYLTAPNLEIWVGASGGSNWGGCNVWVSDDGDSYQMIGRITNPARHGTLYAALAAGSDPDTTHTAYVDMSASGGQLLSGTQADADNGNTLCWLDGEVVSYATATLASADRYALTYLRRGQSGTVSAGHSNGAQFLRLDGAVFRYRVPAERIGSVVWIKLQSINQYGRSPEPLDTVTPHQYTLSGNYPQPLTSLSAAGGLYEVALTWSLPDIPGIDSVEIFGATTDDRSVAYPLTTQKRQVTSWKHPGLQPGQTWFYWARVVDTSGNTSEFFPTSSTGGVSAAPSSDPSALLTQLNSSLGMAQLATELSTPITILATGELGLQQFSDSVAAAVQLVNSIGPTDAPNGLLAVARQQDTTLRALNDASDTAAEAVLRAAVDLNTHGQLISGAGIYTDPATGSVRIEGYERLADRLSTAEIAVDGANAAIALRATVDYVNEAITSAVIDPSQIAELGSLTARVTTAEVGISGLTASVATKATSTDVSNLTGRVTSAETNISGLTASVALKASTTTVGALDTRVGTAETTLAALDVPSITQTVQSARWLDQAGQDSAETQLRALLTGETIRTDAADAVAVARSDMTAYTDSGLSSEASSRLALAAQVGANYAAISTEATTRATADSAESAARLALASTVASNTAAISTEATTRATADSAISSSISIVSATVSGHTSDIAAVQSTATASASAITGLSATYVLRAQANGTYAAMGLGASGSGSAVMFQADNFAITKADGTGSSYMFTVDTVNGTTAVGIDGNLIVDGSVVARSIAAGTITADRMATGVLAVGNISGLGSLATQSSVDFSSLSGAKPAINADATGSAIQGGVLITGGGITLSGGGAFKGGKSSFTDANPGIYYGWDATSGKYVQFTGDPNGSYFEWDGSMLKINVNDTYSPGRASIMRFGRNQMLVSATLPELNIVDFQLNDGSGTVTVAIAGVVNSTASGSGSGTTKVYLNGSLVNTLDLPTQTNAGIVTCNVTVAKHDVITIAQLGTSSGRPVWFGPIEICSNTSNGYIGYISEA